MNADVFPIGMIISANKFMAPTAETVEVTEDTLRVELSDGRMISVPTGWFPRLAHATARERKEWRLVGRGEGIHWPLIDEDISVDGLLAGSPSGESQRSFKKWLAARALGTTNRARKKPVARNGNQPRRKR